MLMILPYHRLRSTHLSRGLMDVRMILVMPNIKKICKSILFLFLLSPATVVALINPRYGNMISNSRYLKLHNDRHACKVRHLAVSPAGYEATTEWMYAAGTILPSYSESGSTLPPGLVTLISEAEEAGASMAAAAAPIMDDATKLGLAAFAGVGIAAAGFKGAVYWRMQYVVAALLTNRVPIVPGGAEVLELSARDTKSLYYVPAANMRRMTLSTIKDLDQSIVNGAAIQAKVPTAIARKQEKGKLNCPSETMDCVVSIYGFSSGVSTAVQEGTSGVTTRVLAQEVARVLKPGGTLLFIEKGEATELVEVVREALGTVEVNIVRNFVDPYCVALGTKEVLEGENEAGSKTASATAGGSNRGNRRFKKTSASKRR